MEQRHETKHKPRDAEIQKGDCVRVKGPDGWVRDYSQVADVGNTSVNLGKGGRCPMRRVSSRIRKEISV